MRTIVRNLKALAAGATLALALGLAAPAAHAQSGYTQTRYPIVLVHGLFGFDTALGVDYFYGIPDALRRGGATVFVAQVSAVNSTEVRGEQLLTQIKQIMALTGAEKVNVIGHSHGSPTARYVAGVAPRLVASVTSVGGANRGSRVVDVVQGAPGSVQTSVAAAAFNAVGNLVGLTSGATRQPQSATGAFVSLSTAGAANFNQRFPQGMPTGCGSGADAVDGVRYYSWTGIQPLTNLLDPSDAILVALSPLFGEANDGLVSACSSRLGRHLGDYRQNHLDEVNQVLGLRDLFSPDPVTLYRQHANRLKLQGV